jgi:hypothetical protein
MTLNILLLCNKPDTNKNANTIVEHIESFERYSKHKIFIYSNLGDIHTGFDISQFDAIIVHYSLCIYTNNYISKKTKKLISEFRGLKVLFIQDEYRKINTVIKEIQSMKFDVLFTCFPEGEMERVYTKEKLPDLSLYNNLTGYIPERLLDKKQLPELSQRPTLLGYRARKLPFWYGELAYEKWNIVEKWHEFVNEPLKVDISYDEKDRIYGKKWVEYLTRCKATLGVESGASVMDFTGDLEKKVEFYQLVNPHKTFRDVQQEFLKNYEGKYKLNQISPRCFEAIALKTVLVLYEGEYSGLLTPWRHYIPLKKDFSNVQKVVSLLKDDDYLQNMADCAYKEIALNKELNYETFIVRVDDILGNEFKIRRCVKATTPYLKEEYDQVIEKKSLYLRGVYLARRIAYSISRRVVKYVQLLLSKTIKFKRQILNHHL